MEKSCGRNGRSLVPTEVRNRARDQVLLRAQRLNPAGYAAVVRGTGEARGHRVPVREGAAGHALENVIAACHLE